MLATFTAVQNGATVPTHFAYDLSFVLGGAAAVIALVLAAFIPQRPTIERHPSLPE